MTSDPTRKDASRPLNDPKDGHGNAASEGVDSDPPVDDREPLEDGEVEKAKKREKRDGSLPDAFVPGAD